MADHLPQYAEDELLRNQLDARERASQEDAAIQGRRRSEAAARALGLSLPPPPPDDFDIDIDAMPPVPERPWPEDAEREPVIEAPIELDNDPADEILAEAQRPAVDDRVADGTESVAIPDRVDPEVPGVVFPRGGPAAVTTGILAAAAAQKPRAEKPVLELRPTALATEIDRIGDQLIVMTDRIELRDRHGGLRRQLALSDIEDVTVERRLTSAVLKLTSRTASDMVVKGLRPDLAEEAQAAVLALLPEVPLISSIEERALMHSILALHRAGVLNEAEVAAKTSFVARMAGH